MQCVLANDRVTIARDESSRAAYLNTLEKESDLEKEKEEIVEVVDTRSAVSSGTHSRTASRASGESERSGREDRQRVIRFEDEDPENPNNCKQMCSKLTVEFGLMGIQGHGYGSNLTYT